LTIRDADEVAVVVGEALHASCAEDVYADQPEWKHTQIGTLNQLASRGIIGVRENL
jgi:hypothetical protein